MEQWRKYRKFGVSKTEASYHRKNPKWRRGLPQLGCLESDSGGTFPNASHPVWASGDVRKVAALGQGTDVWRSGRAANPRLDAAGNTMLWPAWLPEWFCSQEDEDFLPGGGGNRCKWGNSEEPIPQEREQGVKCLDGVTLWSSAQLAGGQFGGCYRSLSHKVPGGSQATARINENSFFAWVWLTAVVNFDLYSLKCASFLSKAEAHLHNKHKRQGKQLLFRFSKVCFSWWHCKNSVTPPHLGGNPNTGDPFNIQKGSLLWNVTTP